VNATAYLQLASWHAATGNDAHSHGLQVSGTGGFGCYPGDPSALAGFSISNYWTGANTDYLLTAASVIVIGAGTALGGVTSYAFAGDVDGNPIMNPATPDMGCKQFSA
jgi:hypothetical protein